MGEAEAAVEATQHWLQEVIVGQAFCPFARRPFAAGRILLVPAPAASDPVVALDILAKRMLQTPSVETALLMLPQTATGAHYAFEDFLDIEAEAHLLLATRYADVLELASFHPQYRFADVAEDDVAQWIHRAPYPLLHLLRTASIEAIMEADLDFVASIPERNHGRAERLGAAYFRQFHQQT